MCQGQEIAPRTNLPIRSHLGSQLKVVRVNDQDMVVYCVVVPVGQNSIISPTSAASLRATEQSPTESDEGFTYKGQKLARRTD
jgi:hypothetical protein